MHSPRFTRRTVLSAMGGAVTAAWGGVRVTAGEVTPRTIPKPRSFFVYGAHLYRHPDPPPAQRRQMVRDIAEVYKFNTIRIYPSWAYQNPEPDRFDFSDTEEVLGYCDEWGLKVLMGVVLEDAPFWLEAAHPEARYVNAQGQACRLGNNGDDVTAGWPGLCLDWSPVRAAAARYLRGMATVVSRHRSRYAYDCWNEPHIEVAEHHVVDMPIGMNCLYCYCSRTIADYQGWLQRRYGTLEKLSAAWVRRYQSWSEIDPPRRLGPYLDWVDWRRFTLERETQELRFRIEQVRAVDPDGLLESHIGLQAAVDTPLAVLGVDPWRLADLVDVWGISYFPRWRVMGSVARGMARLELTRSQAGKKPFWLTELQGGHSERSLRPQDIRLWNWLAIAAGAKGILYWTYHPDIVGPQAGDLGLVQLGGGRTERVVEAAKDHRLIQAHWDILEHYQPNAEVAILFDPDCALLTFAMTGNELVSAQSYRGYYRALWNCDLYVEFIEPTGLTNSSFRVIVVPWHRMLKRETAEALVQFVRTGGTLVLEAGFGSEDEHAFRNFQVPPYQLAEAFGYEEDETVQLSVDAPSDIQGSQSPFERIDGRAPLTFSEPIPVTIKPHTCVTTLTVKGATVIALCESEPVAIKKRLGRGTVYYIGTNFGATIEAGDSGSFALMRAILASAVRSPVTADTVRPRLIEGSGRSLLVVSNENTSDQFSTIQVPARFRRATNVYSQEKQSVRNRSIRITVPAEGVSVLLLE